jgi:hypothetical protein
MAICWSCSFIGNKKIEVASEGILVTASLEAYDFVVTAMLEMAHNRKRENVKVICGNGIFRGDAFFLQSLGLDGTCFFLADHYHLLQRDWPDYFEGGWFSLESLFKNYIYHLPRQRFNPATVSYGKSLGIELIRYVIWTMKYMHTENHLSPTT